MNQPTRKNNKIKLPDGWRVVVARNFEEIETFRPTWEQMQCGESLPAPNVDIYRYLSVVESMKEAVQPHIMLLSYEGKPKVMVIGRIERRQITCRVGYFTVLKPSLRCLTILYGGILGRPSDEVCVILLQELINTLRHGEVDVTFFNHLLIDSHLIKTMTNFLCRDHFPTLDLHWQTHIPESVEAFYKMIPSKHKREWRRCERKLAEEGNGPVKVVCYRNEEEIDYIMEVACEISVLTYKDGMNIGIVDDSLTRALLRQAARDGWLRAYILYVNSVPCAFEFGVRYNATFFPEYMGYDPKWCSFGPGALLWVKVIEDLCVDATIDTLDYGFGDAAYKERLGTKSWPEASVYIFAPRLYPVFINILQSSTRSLSLGLECVLRRIGLIHWVKRCWRNLLQAKNPKSVP